MATQSHTPRKGKRRSHQNHHGNNHHNVHNTAPVQQQAQITDYETDYPDIQPPPMTRTNEELNHAVLRRYYPQIVRIRSIAPYAVLYQFSPESSSWVKLEIEGTLFINELVPNEMGAKRFNVVILNRRGFENYEQELRSSDDVELTSEYVILKGQSRDGEDVVYGLWIFAEPGASTAGAREENAQEISRCAVEAEESRRLAMERLAETQLSKENQRVGGSNGYAAEQESEMEEGSTSIPMGRQLSLRELFGKQREQDAGFTVHHHESPKFANAQPAIPSIEQKVKESSQVKVPTPIFFTSPDTDFFRSGPRFTPRQNEASTSAKKQSPASSADENPLLTLLRGKG
ncbi:uncharacterized protein PV09_00295 [Verruconis gallopava]|uniref:PH domain-containing protein n=1 Tax=Verruconis gallopava TaxID=253628 RepID=A0A0D1Y302_9PEZI|nr:uncharacterized protein PV09_00295 [Verruconis gallopava]KIW09401.1 hypothetical protein PV09_00295 [Verruconis gallopava]